MLYALVHYPAVELGPINRLRSKYDPQFRLIAPHITIMFPTPDSIGERSLVSHIENVLHRWEPFPIRLKGLHQSWDEYQQFSIRNLRNAVNLANAKELRPTPTIADI